MSFGLLTALRVEDCPSIMRGIAANWRRVYVHSDDFIWRAVADLLDKFADEAQTTIVELNKTIPKARRRVRLKD